MSDGWVWFRCKGCGSVQRLIGVSGGNWGLWESLNAFVNKHSGEICHGANYWDVAASEKGYSFFEIVTEQQANSEGEGNVNSKYDSGKIAALQRETLHNHPDRIANEIRGVNGKLRVSRDAQEIAERQVRDLTRELDVARRRIAELETRP